MAMRKAARLQVLLRRMQTVIAMRRMVYHLFPPMTAALLDVRLRLVGAALVTEMRRLEGKVAA